MCTIVVLVSLSDGREGSRSFADESLNKLRGDTGFPFLENGYESTLELGSADAISRGLDCHGGAGMGNRGGCAIAAPRRAAGWAAFGA